MESGAKRAEGERWRFSARERSDKAPVAQLVEQLPFKEKVRGSNPLGGTKTWDKVIKQKFIMVLPIIGYFLIGFLEWVLAAQRTLAISQKRAILASAFVVLENLLWGLVIYSFLTEFSNILAILSYSFGGALGTFFNLKINGKILS